MIRLTRALVIAGLCGSLSGCWFVFIPGSLIQKVSDGITGAKGNHCVGRDATVGSRINIPGVGMGTVVSLSGESVRCTTDRHPIRAELQF